MVDRPDAVPRNGLLHGMIIDQGFGSLQATFGSEPWPGHIMVWRTFLPLRAAS